VISTVNMSDCMIAVRDLLKDFQGVQDIGATVDLAAPVNEDPSRCPRIQIFPIRIAFPPRTLGLGGGFRAQNNEFVVLFQETHANDGDECLSLLGNLVKAGADALLSDISLKGTAQMLGDFEVEFLGVLKTNDAIMQTASLRVVGLTTVSGG
jgi:hypothetical protein